LRRQRILALAAAALVATACSKGGERRVAIPPPNVVVVAVVQQDEPIYQEWIGTTQGDDNAEIRPKVDGYLLRRVYKEGSFVHQGDLLFEIDARQVEAQLEQAQANLEQARSNLAKAIRDVGRYQPLAAEKAISQQELDTARSAEQFARATVGSLQAAVDQARLNRSWTKVTSPISGISGIAQQQVGDLVGPQTVLTTVSRVDPIRVLFQVSERQYLEHQKSPSSRSASLELILADGSVYPHKGHILFSGREVDVKTGTITTIGLFPNPGNLVRPGQYGRVRALVEEKKGALLVPQRALNELQGTFQVAVIGAGNKATVKVVQPGQRIGSLWIIEKGLEPGDRVVVEGFGRVKTGGLVNPVAAQPQNGESGVTAGAK
jgi:membrane fusion protein (multidrug efflux system)